MSKRNAIFWPTVASVLTLSLGACKTAQPAAKTPLPVRTALVETIRTGNPAKYSATILPYSQVDLAFRSTGYVDHILQVKSADGRMRNIDQGDWAKQGTILAVVHQQDYHDKLRQAQAQLLAKQAEDNKARLNFERISEFYAAQSATKPDYDSAKAQLDSASASVDSAEAEISEAQAALEYCSLRAPFDGWIVKRSVDVGSLVGPATEGFTISDTRSVKVVFGVPDLAISGLRLGQRLRIATDVVPGTLYGRISTISPSADLKSRVYSVEVVIQNPQNRLKSGMIATLALGSEELSKPLNAVPLEAVVRDPQKPDAFAVMIADGTGDTATAHLRPVEIGDAYGNKVAILKGLDNTQRVITTGVSLLRDGDSIRLLP